MLSNWPVTEFVKLGAMPMPYCAMDVALVIGAAVVDVSSVDAGHGVGPLVPSTCWPYGESVPLGRAREHLL
jgi:hypothetical protein